MSNKLSINRQRLFTQGYRKYLQSLSHGALVDFVLNGGDLAFSPAQERELLLDQVADEQGRHARATQKINELVHENRRLRERLNEQEPVSTEGAFEDILADIFGNEAQVKVFDGDTIQTVSGQDVLQFLASIFAGVNEDAPKKIVTKEDYAEAHPGSVHASTVAFVLGEALPADIIELCNDLTTAYQPFSTVENVSPGNPMKLVTIQFQNVEIAANFARQADQLGVSVAIYGLYVVNHGE